MNNAPTAALPANAAPRTVQSAAPTDWKTAQMQALIRKRYVAETRFKYTGLAALVVAGLFLIYLLTTIFSTGLSGFVSTQIKLPITYDAAALYLTPEQLQGPDAENALNQADYQTLVNVAVEKLFPNAAAEDKDYLGTLVSPGAMSVIRDKLKNDPSLLGKTVDVWVPASTQVDLIRKGQVDITQPLPGRSAEESRSIVRLEADANSRGFIRTAFNTIFLTGADSRDPELAAVWGATKGSFLTLLVTLLLSFPIGVMAAIYLEEFAPKNRITDFIEVNINNLAAVPSIIFGLLGLAVFLGTFGMARSSPLVGGLTLALLTLPTVVIAGRAAIKAIPPSIRDAARGLGASPLQVVAHHVLPLAMPGILTGTIIGMARALGETAPLLMIGMRAFVTEVPAGPLDGGLTGAATVLPMQVFLWSDSVERGFVEKTSAAIIVLLLFLILMNATAIYLRQRFERRW
jgi:phosphate transport system permease protein